MAKQISDNGISPGEREDEFAPLPVLGEVKAPWHAPVFKRLDVDLTAGTRRNSNDPPTGQNQHLNS